MKKIIFLLFLFFFAITQSKASSTLVGVNAHIFDLDDPDLNRSLTEISKMKFSLIRMDVHWKDIEQYRGVYKIPPKWDLIIKKEIKMGMSPVLILDYGNPLYDNGDKPRTVEAIKAFSNYARYVAGYYNGLVKYFELWNEWDAGGAKTTPGTVLEYKNLVKETYGNIKEVNANAVVIVGAFSAAAFNRELGIGHEDYLKDLLTSDMANYMDAISIHPYTTYHNPPYNEYWSYVKQVEYSIDTIRNTKGFYDKPIFITETGWSTAKSKYGISEEEQAINIINAICHAKKNDIDAILIYDIRNDFPSEKSTAGGFGFFKYNWEPKKSYYSMMNYTCK